MDTELVTGACETDQLASPTTARLRAPLTVEAGGLCSFLIGKCSNSLERVTVMHVSRVPDAR